MTVKEILIFGGNGFIGYELLSLIIDRRTACANGPRWNVTIVNRGKSWDWNKKELLKSQVRCIKWDRNKDLSDCDELQTLFQVVKNFHAVIDFSGYSKRHVKTVLKLINGKTRLYVYISTDSIYEVCCKEHSGLTLETDDHRPESADVVKKLKREESYGHKKLACEECIHKYLRSGDTKFIVLRLADVIGPRDSTDRFWQYHLWVRLSSELNVPVFVPKSVQDLQLSLVYVKDIAMVLWKLLNLNEEDVQEVSNMAYNLAFKEVVKVEDLLNLMYRAILKARSVASGSTVSVPNPLVVKYSSSGNVPHIYPSVEKGPISIQKVERKLQFCPTSLENAVSETCRFYEDLNQSGIFLKEKRDICSELLDDIKGLYSSDVYRKIDIFLKSMLL